jgi:hypothetical protein
MNIDELDQLLAKNEKRIRDAQEKFKAACEGNKNFKEVMNEAKDNWSTKEYYKDCSTSYPTYGRGLTPNINMNTFMV